MFPYVEKKRREDDYGEVVNVAMWVRRGQIMEEEIDDEETMQGQEEDRKRKLK
jgi:cleavage and polyadenylation specificity factor subunit 2